MTTTVLPTFTPSPEFHVNTTESGYQWLPAVTGLAGGGFVTAWESWSDASGTLVNITARYFNANGAATGPEFTIATNVGVSGLHNVTMHALAGGGFVALFNVNPGSPDGSGSAVYGQRFA